MNESRSTLGGAEIPSVARVQIDPERIAAFSTEDDFTEVAVELLVEVDSYVCIAASILPTSTRRWSRDQAIVGGNMVRLYKLIEAVLDQTCQHRRMTSFVFTRLAVETIINSAYLIEFASPELFDSYVRYSLKHERKLHDRIVENIAQRGGEEWPIERRMLNSIKRTFRKSAVSISDVSTNKPKNWGGKNLYERADAVGLGYQYLGVFGGPSHTVHGNWMDLLEYQLDSDDENEGFTPALKWHHPRPQPLFTLARFAVTVLGRYFVFVSGENDALAPELADLLNRINDVDSAHERFLSGDEAANG